MHHALKTHFIFDVFLLESMKSNSIMKYIFTILFLVLTFSVYSQPYFNYPIDTIVKDEFYNYRAMVKYDANGFLHVVNTRQLGTNSATREIFYWTNTSGNFVPFRLTDNNIDDNYSTIGFDEDGKVHIGWARRDGSNLFQLIYTNNRGTGDTFNIPVWITTGGINKATPYMAVGKGDSSVHFAYLTFPTTGTGNAFYRKYNYISNQLGPEVLLGTMSPSSENDIQIAVDSSGFVHIAYTTNASAAGGLLKYFTNESGTLAEVQTGVSAMTQYPAITIDKLSNRVLVIYRVDAGTDRRIFLITREQGGSFTPPQAITPGGIGRPSFYRSIDTDNSGNLFVTYQNSVAKAPRGFFLVYGKPGFSFSPPVLVFEDSTASYIGRGNNSVTARQNGLITVSFDPTASRNGTVASDIMLKTGLVDFTLGTATEPAEVVSDFKLHQNYPNPFNPQTKIVFEIPLNSGNKLITLQVFNSLGQLISELVNTELNPGTYEYTFDGKDLPSGIYYYTLRAGNFVQSKKMILLK